MEDKTVLGKEPEKKEHPGMQEMPGAGGETMTQEQNLIQAVKERVQKLDEDTPIGDCYRMRGLLYELVILKKRKS